MLLIMKRSKVFLRGILALGVVGLFSGAIDANAGAEEYINIPNWNLRYDLASRLDMTDPEVYKEYQNYGVLRKNMVEGIETDTEWTGITNYGLEGLYGAQYLKNTKELSVDGANIDFRAVGNMPGVEVLNIYNDTNRMTVASVKTGLTDLSFIEDYSSLKRPVYASMSYEDQALTDISNLDNISTLESFDIHTFGTTPSITMKNGYRKYEVFQPIIFSSHLDNLDVDYSSDQPYFTNQDGLLKWSAVPYGTEKLSLRWYVTSDDHQFVYKGDVEIPIVWK